MIKRAFAVFHCDICGFTFPLTDQKYLNYTMHYTGEKPGPVLCPTCFERRLKRKAGNLPIFPGRPEVPGKFRWKLELVKARGKI